MLMFAQVSLFGAVATTGGQSFLTTAGQTAQTVAQSLASKYWGATPSASSMPISTRIAKISSSAYDTLTPPSTSSTSSISTYAVPTLAAASLVAGVLQNPTAQAYARQAWNGARSTVGSMFKVRLC